MIHKIEIDRNKAKGTGKLFYQAGGVKVDTPCWFELFNPILAKMYTGCSATHMSSKKNSLGQPREAVYLPDKQTNRRGIFIHMGKNSAWSDGCIVIEERELLKIWKNIQLKNATNITVVVKDV